MTGALVVWILLIGIAWFTSEGEPVCEGIFILDVETSLPPQCDGPIEGLLQTGPILLFLLLFVGWVGFLAATGLAQRRERRA